MELGQDDYEDPDTGYLVFTSAFLAARGACCEGGCRHCPYRDHVLRTAMTAPWPALSTPAARASAQCPTAASTLSAEKRRSRRLLETTNTDENAIAAPAIIGLRYPAAARGNAATL